MRVGWDISGFDLVPIVVGREAIPRVVDLREAREALEVSRDQPIDVARLAVREAFRRSHSTAAAAPESP